MTAAARPTPETDAWLGSAVDLGSDSHEFRAAGVKLTRSLERRLAEAEERSDIESLRQAKLIGEVRNKLAEAEDRLAVTQHWKDSFTELSKEMDALQSAHDNALADLKVAEEEAEDWNKEACKCMEELVKQDARVRALEGAFWRWWLEHHDDSHFFNEVMQASPELAAKINAALQEKPDGA